MIRQALAIVVAAFMLGGLPARAEEVVRLGNLKLAHFAAVSYSAKLGAKCPVKIEERVFSKGTEIMNAIEAGEIDVGASGSEAAISARAVGVPIFVVAGFASGGIRFLRRPDAAITKMEDLKGMRVGVTRGGIQEIMLAAALAKAGLTWSDKPGKDITLTYLLYPDLNQALMAKNLDAIAQTEPQSAQAITQGFGVEFGAPYESAIGSPVRTLVMTEKFYAKRAAALGFLTCFVEATNLFIKSPDIAEKYVTETMFKGQLSGAEFRAAIANAPYTFDISADQIQVTADLMVKYGVSKTSQAPRAADYVKTDLLDEAKRSLGIKP